MKRRLLMLTLGCVHSSIAATVYVSPTGHHTAPYDTWHKAATDIHAAVAVATNSGDVVILDDNDESYSVSAPVIVDSAIEIKSRNGPEFTVIDGGGVAHCFELENVSCVLNGLTITNGFATDGGGIACSGDAPVITNCVVVGNRAEYGGGILQGTLYNSVIRGNTATSQGGGCFSSTAYNCLIISNKVLSGGDYGGGVEFGSYYNCTIVENSAPDAGGADNCDLYNSIIYSNTAPLNPDSAYSTLINSCSRTGDSLNGSFISDDPLFVNAASGNYRLQATSPCMDGGSNIYVIGTVDLDGGARISGGIVDMGAYEVQQGAVDRDGDGMDDGWEIFYFGSTNTLPDAHGDTDMQINLDEYIAGTDPTDKDSFFSITNWSAGGYIIAWSSVAERQYRVLWSDALTNGFQYIGPLIDHPQDSYTDTLHSAESSAFYKVEVQLK